MTNQAFSLEGFSGSRAAEPAAARSRTHGRVWAGRGISGFLGLFLLFDGAMKIVKPSFVLEATRRLGYPESALGWIGMVLIASTLLYLLPRTRLLGALLLTGYLGGATDAQVRAGSSAFEIFFPVIFGVLIWVGLWLRDRRIGGLL